MTSYVKVLCVEGGGEKFITNEMFLSQDSLFAQIQATVTPVS
jgi:hypothetical protein